ncbi:hypothetical protein LshimejAT787_0203110 [Lyophyllum shimeji]|uniref:Uncharacterized protein n=1 Tax=Lyophyllum shimeji TaxID=47721 RepID=A0A9P3PF66_LYOSH|nr:hypothetical protein LshimejAT787_0203110 [Lyophyllum shimeji]
MVRHWQLLHSKSLHFHETGGKQIKHNETTLIADCSSQTKDEVEDSRLGGPGHPENNRTRGHNVVQAKMHQEIQ